MAHTAWLDQQASHSNNTPKSQLFGSGSLRRLEHLELGWVSASMALLRALVPGGHGRLTPSVLGQHSSCRMWPTGRGTSCVLLAEEALSTSVSWAIQIPILPSLCHLIEHGFWWHGVASSACRFTGRCAQGSRWERRGPRSPALKPWP